MQSRPVSQHRSNAERMTRTAAEWFRKLTESLLLYASLDCYVLDSSARIDPLMIGSSERFPLLPFLATDQLLACFLLWITSSYFIERTDTYLDTSKAIEPGI